MKRVTIIADDVRPADSSMPGMTAVEIGVETYYVPDARVISIEDAPDPLPTDPGIRFYGRSNRTADEWWFTVLDVDADGQPDPARLTYISARYQEWSPGQAQEFGLVRVPDPEVTA